MPKFVRKLAHDSAVPGLMMQQQHLLLLLSLTDDFLFVALLANFLILPLLFISFLINVVEFAKFFAAAMSG
jgi:hypothetical protein